MSERRKGDAKPRFWKPPTADRATDWGEKLKDIEEKLREKAVKLGLDPSSVMLGAVIEYILGDDSNVFAGPMADFISEFSDQGRTKILKRLEWEGKQALPDELDEPGGLRERIGFVKKYLEQQDNWDDKGRVVEAYSFWRENLHDWVEQKKGVNPYKKACEDYQDVYKELQRNRGRGFSLG